MAGAGFAQQRPLPVQISVYDDYDESRGDIRITLNRDDGDGDGDGRGFSGGREREREMMAGWRGMEMEMERWRRLKRREERRILLPVCLRRPVSGLSTEKQTRSLRLPFADQLRWMPRRLQIT